MNKSFSARTLKRFLLILVALIAFLLVLEAGYFMWALAGDKALEKADLIVVFEGGFDRARCAYSLVDRAYAPNLLVSPGTEKKLAIYEKRFRPTRPYDRVMEDKSRTTFENAVHTGEVLAENGFQSAILVTSWDHMPRSYFLLRAMTLGSGSRIQQHFVARGGLNQTNWYSHLPGWKMVYNEMVQFWGSLVELALYGIRGELPADPPGKSGLAALLKKILLFDIDHRSLHD
jgi:uncharacterized SAM-binding protein YcdF (DUF218 family)